MKKIVLLFLVFFLSCTRNSDLALRRSLSPEDVVKKFIELSAGSKDAADKKKLQDLCSGEMRRAFDRMSAEEFKLTYINSNVKILNLKFLESNIQVDLAKVHYQVLAENNGVETTKELNEREVELTHSQGVWYISYVRLKGTDKLAFTRGMIF